MVGLWSILGVTLYILSGLIGLAWHWGVHHRFGSLGRWLGWLDARVSGLRPGHIWAVSALLVALYTALILTVGAQTPYRDPFTYHEAVSNWLDGGNPYEGVGDRGEKIAYTAQFVFALRPFVSMFGFQGVFLATAAMVLLAPPLAYHAARAYQGGRRMPAYAGLLMATTPMVGFHLVRYASEEGWVILSILAGLYLFLQGRRVMALVVASLLSVKFVTFLPVIAWCLGCLREVGWRRQVRRAAIWITAVALPYLVVLVPSWLAWGDAYLQAIYVRTTVERTATLRPTVNIYHVAQQAGIEPPSFMFLLILGALAATYLYIYLRGSGDLVLAGAGVVAVALVVIDSVNRDFVAWLFPLVLLYSLGYSGRRLLVSPLFAVSLTGLFHAHNLARHTLGPGLAPVVTGTSSVLVTAALAIVVYHWVALDGEQTDRADGGRDRPLVRGT